MNNNSSEERTGIEKIQPPAGDAQLSKASGELLKNFQAVGKSLGGGAFADVFLFQSRTNTKMKYAVKIMFKEDLD